jgi:chaperonin GroEL
MLGKNFGTPTITKDGATVAKEIVLDNSFQNVGAKLVREAAAKTARDAGDGTTTATVLATAILRQSLKNVTAGANPMFLKRGIEQAVTIVNEDIKRLSLPVDDREQIKSVAMISANNDEEIGEIEPPRLLRRLRYVSPTTRAASS